MAEMAEMKFKKKYIVVLFAVVFLYLWIGGGNFINIIDEGYICPDCNVIIISIETLRADHLGCYGYHRNTSSFIDSVAGGGILFEKCITPNPKTSPSLASMLTGLYPYRTGVRTLNTPLVSNTTLPTILKQEGYTTAAFVSNWALIPKQSGFDRYFDVYDFNFTRSELNRKHLRERNAEETNQKVIEWLGKNYDKKFLLWIHYMDPHGAYYPPKEYRSTFTHTKRKLIPRKKVPRYQKLPNAYAKRGKTDANDYIDQYDNEIYYLDRQLEKLFDEFNRLNVTEESLIIITADHGESLVQHDYYFEHGREIYDDCSRIPLIIRFPEYFDIPDKRIRSLVSNMDIYPSILSFLNIKTVPESEIDGVNLLPLVHGEDEIRADVFIESEPNKMNQIQRIGIRTDDYKLIKRIEGYECYDLKNDPLELNNDGCNNQTFDSLDKRLGDHLKTVIEDGNVHAKTKLTEKEKDILRSLGYLN